ncbi:MAG: hypothetical protein NTW38_12670 [Candidatus Aminicenantes bacterium]|nr:hypothetical protein [Candidatus Aminicenantes bacterium]
MADGKRTGEKAGWIGSWLWGFLWVVVLAVIYLFQRKTVEGVLGLILFLIAVFFVFVFSPWRHPAKPFWTLMLPLYLVFFTLAAWMISSYGGFKNSGLHWWHLFLIIPILSPLGAVGGRKWTDGEKPRAGTKNPESSRRI